jgi:hypothetical protein
MTDHTTADQPDDFGVPMKPGRFIHHDDGTSTFIPDQPDGEPIDLLDLLDVLDGPYGWRADLEALLRRHVLTARIAELESFKKRIKFTTYPDAPKTNNILMGQIDDRLTVLRDEIAGLEGEK